MNFGQALELLKKGKSVYRAGWNGAWLQMQMPELTSKMTQPYIYIEYPKNKADTNGSRIPWVAPQADLLSNDWVYLA